MALEKAKILIEHTKEELKVLFNPAEYTLNQDNNFAPQNVPGLSGPLLQFVHGNLRTLEMELFFDTHSPARDVRKETDKVVRLMEIDSELHAPPVLVVSWGSLLFRCVLARVSQQFTQFAENGYPVRARLNVTFNEFLDPDRESRQVNRLTADFSKVHVMARGDRLIDVATRYYEDPTMWRAIAIENAIDDPQADLTGVVVKIPALPFIDPETREVLE